MPWIHTHSRYSARDALPAVEEVVERAVALQYPALALTDHGTMAGSVELYQHCRAHDLAPLPGMEAYLSYHRQARSRSTVHLGLVAYTTEGYRNLVRLNNQMVRGYYYKPLIDVEDLRQFAEAGATRGVLATTGCFFGLLPTLLRRAPDAVDNVLTVLAGIFPDALYAEVQHHGIYSDDHDDDVLVRQVMDVAARHGLPVVLGGDSHYCHSYERRAHNALKRLVSFDDPDDAVFPGESGYHMRSMYDYATVLEPDVMAAVTDGLTRIAERAEVVIPELDTFRMRVPPLPYADPADTLRRRAQAGLAKLAESGGRPAAHHHKYGTRLATELDTIIAGDFAEIVLIVADLCDWMRTEGIFYWIRGSATASLVLHALGVNRLDPLAWKLDFARFLSTDRTKPPDVDIDVPTDRRQEVLDHLASRYATRPIGTRSTLSAQVDSSGTWRGSLVNMLHSMMSKRGEPKQATAAQYSMLAELSEYSLVRGPSRHAGGILLGSALDLQALPLMRVGTGMAATSASAYDKNEVEALGYVKLDVLGVKELQGLSLTAELTGIPMLKADISTSTMWTRIGNGQTDGVFQLGGWAMKNGCRRLKPRSVLDLVIAQALFRPAVDAVREQYLRRRAAQDHPDLNEPLRRAVGETYGVFLFQEQMITLLRELGMAAEELTAVLKAVKASNKAVAKARVAMEAAQSRVDDLMTANGTFSPQQRELVHDAMHGYAEYGFNRAHATSYAVMAAISGYYATHHPLEFWVGQLVAHTGDDKEEESLAAARNAGIRTLAPDVNLSAVTYSMDPREQAIRRGLRSLPGIGESAASKIVAGQPYADLTDFAARAGVSGCKDLGLGHSPLSCPGVVQALAQAKAFRSITRGET